MGDLFNRRKNRFCVFFPECGLVPVADCQDDTPTYVTAPPVKVGDTAIIFVEGRHRKVVLMRSAGSIKNNLYLVDQGQA